MSLEYDKLLLEISDLIHCLSGNITTNKNIDTVNSTRADSVMTLVDSYALVYNAEQCSTNILINLPELPTSTFNRKSRK